MKKTIAVLLIQALLLSSGVYAKPLTGEIHVDVKGMVCAFCVHGLTKVFKKQDAIDKVDVSLEKKSIDLVTKKDQSIDSEKILELIKDAGYEGVITDKK